MHNLRVLEPITDRDEHGRAVLALSLEHIARLYPDRSLLELKVLVGDTLLNMRRTGCRAAPMPPPSSDDEDLVHMLSNEEVATFPILHPFTDAEEKQFEQLLANHRPRIGITEQEEAEMLERVAAAFDNHSLEQIREHYVWLWFDILVRTLRCCLI